MSRSTNKKLPNIRPRGESQSKFTLFPFLAVLLCTMGALIMILVLVARNVREGVIVGAPMIDAPIATVNDIDEWEKANAENPLPKLTSEEASAIYEKTKLDIEEADWLMENHVKNKATLEREFAEDQARLAVQEQLTEKTKEELNRLMELGKELSEKQKNFVTKTDDLKKNLEILKQRRTQAETEVGVLQKENGERAKSYSIMPYQGQGGTFRQPIFIECVKNQVILQPEGIVLSEDDFILADRQDNPLSVAIRAAKQYSTELGYSTQPYPLFVVRPSGVSIYPAALESVTSCANEYGYELVTEDVKIEYPNANDELRKRLNAQIDVSRTRMVGFLSAMQAHAATSQTGQYRVGRNGVERIEKGVPDYAENYRNRRSPPTPSGNVTRSEMPNDNGSPSSQASWHRPNAVQEQPGIPYSSAVPQRKYDHSAAVTPANSQPPQQYEMNVTYETPSSADKQYDPLQMPRTYSSDNAQCTVDSMTGEPQSASVTISSAKNKGQNWALKGVTRTSVGMTRTIRLQCYGDKFVLVPQAGLTFSKAIPITGQTAPAVDQLVRAVDAFTDSWGGAGDNMYWKPVLKIQVDHNELARNRFNELTLYLRDSGFVIDEVK